MAVREPPRTVRDGSRRCRQWCHYDPNAMQLVAATIRTITGMIKTRTQRRRRTLTDTSSSANSHSQSRISIICQLITVGIFVDFCDSRCIMLYRK